MRELTYRDYIKYLEVKMSNIHADVLTPDERRYFKLIMKQLDTAPGLPSYILDEPLLSSNNYDEETLAAIAEVKDTISIQGRIDSYLDFIVAGISQKIRNMVYFFRSTEVAGAVISVILLAVFIFMLLNFPTVSNSSGLSGAAGMPTPDSTLTPNLPVPPSAFSPIGLLGIGMFIVLLIVSALINRKK